MHDKYIRKTLLEPPEPEIDEVFSVWRLPSQRRLWEAGTCFLRDENGSVLAFSELFPRRQGPGPEPRTVVFFIRQFWCGMCQDYISESVARLDPDVLAAHNIRVVVIGDGPWEVIKAYRKVLNCPFPVYTDGPRHLYRLLGMVKHCPLWRAPPNAGKAGYNKRHTVVQAYSGVKNGIVHFPLLFPGHMSQLGGEFVFAPGYRCEFAHRMTTMGNHMEAHDVVRRAGLDIPAVAAPLAREFTTEQLAAVEELETVSRKLVAEAESMPPSVWQEQRNAELERMRMKRANRRGVVSPELERRHSGWEGYVAENDGECDGRPLAAAVQQVAQGRPIEPQWRSDEEMDKAFHAALVAEEKGPRESAIGMAI